MLTDDEDKMKTTPLIQQPGSTANDGLTIPLGHSLMAAMAAADPKATGTALLAGLPRSITRTLKENTKILYPQEGGFTEQFLGYELMAPVSAQDLSLALILAKLSLRPASKAEIVALLARVKVKTQKRSESDQDVAFQIAVYADDLGEWPGDVVRFVLARWPSQSDFFPNWNQLEKKMYAFACKRRAMVLFLEQELAKAH